MAGNVAMEPLVKAEEAEKVVWALGGGSTAFSLPVQGCEVICLAENGTLANVEGLGDGLEMEEPPG